jgi:hypothetical protein
MIKAIKYDKGVEYFRGVDFHLIVLMNEQEILSLLPSFVSDGSITELKTIHDSIKLGQFLLYTDLVCITMKHPNLLVQPGSLDEKYPKYLANDIPIFKYNGCY